MVFAFGYFQTAAAQRTTTASAAPITLTIHDAIRLASENNASALSARSRIDASAAQVRQRRAELFPHLNVIGQQGARTFNTASLGIDLPTAPGQPPVFDPDGEVRGPVTGIDYRGRLSQSILDFGALLRIRTSQSIVRSNTAEAQAIAEQAGASAAVAYIRVLRSEDEVKARNADSALAADLLSIAKQQLDAGVGISLDVTRAEARVAEVRAQAIASRNTRSRAGINLLRALGLPLNTTYTLTDSLGEMDPSDITSDEASRIATARNSRSDIRAIEERLTAANQAVGAIRAERLPSIGFVGDKGVNGKRYRNLLNTYNYAFQISLPLFDGFRREGRIQEQRAQLREIEILHDDLVEQMSADIRNAWSDLVNAREQVVATREREKLAELEVAQARERFQAGVAGNADVITASLSLTSARMAVIETLTGYHVARASLAYAEGSIDTLK